MPIKICSFQILHIIDQKFTDFEDVIKKYVRGEGPKIDMILKDYMEKPEISLFAVCNIAGQEEKFIQNHKEHWITFIITEINGKFFVFFKDSFESKEYIHEKLALRKYIEEKLSKDSSINFVEHSNREECTIHGSDISIALNNLNIILERFNSGNKENFEKLFQETIFYSSNNISIDFDRLIVNIGLSNRFRFRLKPALQKILSALQRVTEKDKRNKLEHGQLTKLIETLENNNFLPREQDEIDLRVIVIDLIIVLIERGQILDENIQKKINKYFVNNKNQYIKKVEEFDKILREDSRNSQIAGCLSLALKDLLKFFTNIEKLIPNSLEMEDFEMLFKLLGNINEHKTLDIQRVHLENELRSVVDSDKQMDIKFKLSNVRQQLDYFARKSEICMTINIDDLVIIIGTKVEHFESTDRCYFSQDTLDHILLVGKTIENRNVALAVIKILNFIDLSKYTQTDEDLDKVLCNIVSKIPQSEGKFILNLSKNLELGKHSSLLKFLHEILIENDDKQVRYEALNILKSCEFYPEDLEYITNAIEIEEKCTQTDNSILHDLLQRVKVRNKLTLNCFEQLTKYFEFETTYVIINEIVEHGVQQLPKSFIEKSIQYIETNFDNKKYQLIIASLCKSLLKGQYISLSQIQNNIEKFIDDENLNAGVFDLLSIEVRNEHSIPISIVDKLKHTAKHSEYAANLIKLIEKEHSPIDILENPRESIENRKEALKNIMTIDQNCTIATIKTLESVIKYDLELRTYCFKVLVAILPENYTKKDIKIDFASLMECINYDQNISLDDIRSLVKKDANVDLSYILTFILHRIHIERDIALHLLSEIANRRIKTALDETQCKFLLALAFDCTDFDSRAKIINILETMVEKNVRDKMEILKFNYDGNEITYSLTDELNKLHNLQNMIINQQNLVELSKTIEKEGYKIVEDHIKSLIEALDDAKKKDLREQIIDILFQIEFTQGLTHTESSALLYAIEKHPELIGIDSAVGIVATSCTKNIEIPDKVLQSLWRQVSKDLEEKKLRYNSISILKAIVTQKKQIPKLVLETLVNSLTCQDFDLQNRLLLADIVYDAIELLTDDFQSYQHVIEKLKIIVLQTKKNRDEYRLNKIIFRALQRSIEENDSSHELLSRYYDIFKEDEINHEQYSMKEWNPLNNYMKRKSHALEKFHLMIVIDRIVLKQQKIDTSIFNEFQETEWRKEILCSELLTGIFLEANNAQGIDEFELEKFRENLSVFSSCRDESISVENILQALIDKQNIYELNLEMINDILMMLQTNIEGFNILRNENRNSFYMELREQWLGKRLEYFDIEYSDTTLEIFNAYLPYKIEIIDEVLKKINEHTTIDELIKFFNYLLNCGLTKESIETFLTNDIPYRKSISTWQLILTDRLVGMFLMKKFPSYGKYLQYTKFEFNRNNLIQNAYNQANSIYYYNVDDLTRISTEWMKEFVSNFRITSPLCHQSDRSLSSILTNVLNEYLREKKPTIFCLNISSNHWVSVALINNKDKDIVLYKDSLGEDSYVDEREELKVFLNDKIEKIDFKFHRSCDQFNSYDSGVFALANMKIIATYLKNKKESFIHYFETSKFTSQSQATHDRINTFPKMYALSLCRPFRKKQILDYHSVELKFIEEILEKNVFTGDKLQLSISLPDKDNLIEKNYRYLYVIEAMSAEIDFNRTSELKTKIVENLGIKELYSVKGNVMTIIDDKLTAIQKKKNQKLEMTLTDNEIDELLNKLGVELTEYNRDVLKKTLGFTMKKYLTIQGKEIVEIEDYKLVVHLHRKLNKIRAIGWPMNSVRILLDFINSEDELKHMLHALDPIFEYNLFEYDRNDNGDKLFDILKSKSTSKWRKEIHELAIFQTFIGSNNKALETLNTELYEINKDNHVSFLCDDKLIAAYMNVQHAYKEKSKLFDNLSSIEHWKSSEIQQWAEKVKSMPNEVSQHEKLAVIKRAIEITSKFPPREIQLLSVLILTNPEEHTGRLAQINTGEGKTTIVAMLAAVKALDGQQVDVITRS
ncbi:unnamed protein product, partial [Rotaria sp. Silwood2]